MEEKKEIGVFIDETIQQCIHDQSKVLVFPIQCGLGKTSHIREMIRRHLFLSQGLIVVTDSLAGLKDLAGLPPTDKNYTEYLNGLKDDEQRETVSYLNANRDQIAYLDSETIRDELSKLYCHDGKPIILMSTQRYFELKPVAIQQLTSGAISRRLIVFDEKPFMTEQRKITVEQFNTVDSALHMAITSNENQDNKQFMIDYWSEVKEQINQLYKWYEDRTQPGQTTVEFHMPNYDIDQERERFFHLVNDTYRKQLDEYSMHYCNVNVRRDVKAAYQALTEGATFTSSKRTSRDSRDSSKYENYFTVVLDNSDHLLNIGAKVVVFDGTADLHPDYDLDYIDMVDCGEYKRQLSNLTIKVVDCVTTKNRLASDRRNKDSKLLKIIAQDIKARYRDPVIFCHKEREAQLHNLFGFSIVGHFGALKGLNTYQNTTSIVQIGTNRYPDGVYTLTALHNELYTSKRIMGKDGTKRMPRAIKIKAATDKNCGKQGWMDRVSTEIRDRTILADIEQNLFRGAIRRADFKGQMTFTIYMSAYNTDRQTGEHVYNQLVQMMIDRYGSVGAKVEVIDAPEIKILSRKGKSNSARIAAWCQQQPNGKVFKLKEMLQEIGMTNEEFKQAKRSNNGLHRMFDQMRIAGRRGYFKIPN